MKVMTLSIEEVFIKKVGLEVCNHPKVKSVVVRKQGLLYQSNSLSSPFLTKWEMLKIELWLLGCANNCVKKIYSMFL